MDSPVAKACALVRYRYKYFGGDYRTGPAQALANEGCEEFLVLKQNLPITWPVQAGGFDDLNFKNWLYAEEYAET